MHEKLTHGFVFCVKCFEKYAKIMHFCNFLKKIFSKFPTNCVFRANARKINEWLVEFFEKYAKIIDFS